MSVIKDFYHFKGLDDNGDPILVPYTDEEYRALGIMIERTSPK
jgi:hypothetical protein